MARLARKAGRNLPRVTLHPEGNSNCNLTDCPTHTLFLSILLAALSPFERIHAAATSIRGVSLGAAGLEPPDLPRIWSLRSEEHLAGHLWLHDSWLPPKQVHYQSASLAPSAWQFQLHSPQTKSRPPSRGYPSTAPYLRTESARPVNAASSHMVSSSAGQPHSHVIMFLVKNQNLALSWHNILYCMKPG